MSYATENPKTTAARPRPDAPRIVDEHHITGPQGEDEIEAVDDQGRRWYHPRPEPRTRADMLGFNYTWWLILLFVVFAFVPWW
jgi:hypothetical protein